MSLKVIIEGDNREGKSTLAAVIEQVLQDNGCITENLDDDHRVALLEKAARADRLLDAKRVVIETRGTRKKPIEAPQTIRVLFDGPPSSPAGRFVEVEDLDGHSIQVGEWKELRDGCWALEIPAVETRNVGAAEVLEREAAAELKALWDMLEGCTVIFPAGVTRSIEPTRGLRDVRFEGHAGWKVQTPTLPKAEPTDRSDAGLRHYHGLRTGRSVACGLPLAKCETSFNRVNCPGCLKWLTAQGDKSAAKQLADLEQVQSSIGPIDQAMEFLKSRDGQPHKVIVDKDGQALPPQRAVRFHDVRPAVVFIRKDGWTLGAPVWLIDVALQLWKDEWAAVYRVVAKQLLTYEDWAQQRGGQ